jgi:hypothetical protein
MTTTMTVAAAAAKKASLPPYEHPRDRISVRKEGAVCVGKKSKDLGLETMGEFENGKRSSATNLKKTTFCGDSGLAFDP